MEHLKKRAWATVDLNAATHNLAVIRERITPGCKLMAVLKADAYGHGDQVLAVLCEEAGADWFGVSSLEEALSLRAAGATLPILVLGAVAADEAETLAEYSITQTVYSLDYAKELSRQAQLADVRVGVHIKIDTGMNRIGLSAASEMETAVAQALEIAALPGLRVDGAFSHFASGDEAGEEAETFTLEQAELFAEACRRIEAAGVPLDVKHCCNSGGMYKFPEYHMDMVRLGIILFLPGHPGEYDMGLRPVMEIRSRISMVKEVKAGQVIGYGRTYKVENDMRMATVTFGYADGYSRALSNRGELLLHGKRAPIVGRVCMDQLMIDVTHIPEAKMGDVVTIVGRDGGEEITFEEVADRAGTITQESLCAVGKRVPRIYIKDGKEVEARCAYPVK